MALRNNIRVIKTLTSGEIVADFDYYFSGTRYRKRVTVPKSALRSVYRDWQQFVLTGESRLFENKRNIVTVSTVIESYLENIENTKTPKRLKSISHSLKFFTEFLKTMPTMGIDDIEPKHIDDFHGWLKGKDYADATVLIYINSVSMLMSWAIQRGYYHKVNPTTIMLEKPKQNKKRIINVSGEQIQEILQGASKLSDHFYLAVQLAIKTGMRLSEIVFLEWKWINFQERQIVLPREITKAGADRVVCLSPDIADRLKEYRKKNTFSQRVFDITPNAISRAWQKFAQSLSFTVPSGHLHFHDLRHIHGQLLLDAGLTINEVQRQLGHASSQITEKYYVTNRLDLRDKIGVIDEKITDCQNDCQHTVNGHKV